FTARHETGIPLIHRFGLFQEGASSAAELAYLNDLQRVMLPRLLLRFEDKLKKPQPDAVYQYDSLETYLMLGGQAPKLEPRNVAASVTGDWAAESFPGRDLDPVRDRLSRHLTAMLDD